MNEKREHTEPSPPRLTLRLAEVAKATGVPLSTARDWIRRGLLPCIRIPARPGARRAVVLVRVDALEEFLARHSSPARAS